MRSGRRWGSRRRTIRRLPARMRRLRTGIMTDLRSQRKPFTAKVWLTESSRNRRITSRAGRAIDRFTDFITLYPNDPRVEEAQKLISDLRLEQARGNFETARFYEKKKRWNGA